MYCMCVYMYVGIARMCVCILYMYMYACYACTIVHGIHGIICMCVQLYMYICVHMYMCMLITYMGFYRLP